MNVVLASLLFVSSSTGSPPEVTGAAGNAPLLTREEPHLAAGRRALSAGDFDTAIERFRQAVTTTDTERAVVEYDVGQALTMRALAEAQAAQTAASPSSAPGAAVDAPQKPPTPPNVDEAVAALERAATLSRDPHVVSEAHLAAGNAALVGGKLDDAIAHLRRSLVADPQNDRARRNLQRALTMRHNQPPPPKDGDKNDGDKNDGQKNDGDKSDGDKNDGDKNDGDKNDGDKNDGDKNDGQKNEGHKNGEHKNDADRNGSAPQTPSPDPSQRDGSTQAPPPPRPAPTSKEEARRLLQGLRSRERPLSPMQMRGTTAASPASTPEKDW
jgi:tetratricopeptide (TPR) repeat protein